MERPPTGEAITGENIVSQDQISAVLFGENKEMPPDMRNKLSLSLEALVAYRPSAFARHNIGEIDKILAIVFQPPSPIEVKKVVESVKTAGGGWWSWPLTDGAHVTLGHESTLMQLEQVLWERSSQGSPFQITRPPDEQQEWFQDERRWIERSVVAKAAALQAQSELPFDTSGTDIRAVQGWVNLRTDGLKIIVAAEGVERTALAFGKAPHRETFVEQLTNFTKWLTDNHHPQLDRQSQTTLRRVHDFVKQNFGWLEIYDAVRSVHSSDVIEQAIPLVYVAYESPLALEISPTLETDYDRLSLIELNSGGVFRDIRSKNGYDIPVIIIKPSKRRERQFEIRTHEQAHAVYDSQYSYSPGFTFPKTEEPDQQTFKRLQIITDLSVMPRAKNEIVAYLYEGKDFSEIENILTTNPLYDYFSRNRDNWDITSGNDDYDYYLGIARRNYFKKLHQVIKIASNIDRGGRMDRRDLAVLLAILPTEQWHHFLPSNFKW